MSKEQEGEGKMDVHMDLNQSIYDTPQQAEVRPCEMRIWEAIDRAQNNLEQLKNLITEYHITNFDESRNERTPLGWASEKGYVDIVSFLINHGANVNQQYGLFNFTALRGAVLYDQADIVELLIASGADLESETVFGTALEAAVLGHNWDIAMLLFLNGAHAEQPYLNLLNMLKDNYLQARVEVVNDGLNIHPSAL